MSVAGGVLSAHVCRRPRVRGDCANGPRPCPWTRGRYHLAGTVRGQVTETCALDVAARGGATLDEVGRALGVTRERIRQIETKALRKLCEGGAAQVRELLGEESGGEPVGSDGGDLPRQLLRQRAKKLTASDASEVRLRAYP